MSDGNSNSLIIDGKGGSCRGQTQVVFLNTQRKLYHEATGAVSLLGLSLQVHYSSIVWSQYVLRELILLLREDGLNWSKVTVKTFIIPNECGSFGEKKNIKQRNCL